ncbi:zinc-binding dehydrogenase [Actinoallomurus sp. NBC_01490]|uniref:zinc-binding dehydrogenase n=1 Tax=Actinoallomurus sp. NBC_01490 TaxID=2903557 RepID=UPI002E35B2DC|nr:zinc-binding dehydrogenase [Actinoallomurus sp. NBC_01490]
MRAWKLEEAGQPIRLAEVPEPAPRGGGVIVSVLAAYLPAYTEALTQGARGTIPTPLVLGAGGIGRVESVADDVFNVAPGDIVVINPLLSSGETDGPQEILVGWTGVGGRGKATATTTAMQAVWRDGLWAERALCPKETVVRLAGAEEYARPDRLAFLGWLAIAAEGLNSAGQRPGQTVAVIGGTGQLGAATLLMSLARGAARVVAVGRNTAVLDRLAGLDPRVRTVAFTGDRARDAAAIGEVDVVIDALGAVPGPDPTLTGFDALRPGGTMALIGGVRQDLPLPYGDIMRRRLTVRGSWMCPPETVLDVWRMVAAGTLDLDVLEPHPVGLDDPAGAVKLAAGASGPEFAVLVPGAAMR